MMVRRKGKKPMDQDDELSLWLAGAWLRAAGDEIQSLVVEDIEEQAKQGTPVTSTLKSLAASNRQPGDFGMEIAGTLLAPVLLEFLKAFWASYLKSLAEKAGKAVADATTHNVKAWFISAIRPGKDDKVMADLQSGIADLAARGKLSQQEATGLLTGLKSTALSQELAAGHESGAPA
jgi:hypothetical protein